MGTSAAQCKGNVGRHFTASLGCPCGHHPPLRRWRSTSRQNATVPFRKLLRISLRSGRWRQRRRAVYREDVGVVLNLPPAPAPVRVRPAMRERRAAIAAERIKKRRERGKSHRGA